MEPLLGRTLVLVAHPDDEAVGCGILLQRMRDPIVVFAIDGAPRSEYYWHQYGSREGYAALRLAEAGRALECAGVSHFHQLNEENPVADQELFFNLECAYVRLAALIESEVPEAILTLAYEGGHPDHDSCSFLASFAGSQYELPVWEMPLYQRATCEMSYQSFVAGEGITLEPSSPELSRKREMLAAYRSQAQVLAEFKIEVESVREMSDYDFSQPPHSGLLNYEAWQWPMQGADLCRAFAQFLERPFHQMRKLKWESTA